MTERDEDIKWKDWERKVLYSPISGKERKVFIIDADKFFATDVGIIPDCDAQQPLRTNYLAGAGNIENMMIDPYKV